MSVLKRSAAEDFVIDDPNERARRAVGVRVCLFANNVCACRTRHRLCVCVEAEADAIIDALRTVWGD